MHLINFAIMQVLKGDSYWREANARLLDAAIAQWDKDNNDTLRELA